MAPPLQNIRERTYNFFESPSSLPALLFRVFTIVLILYSGVSVGIEFFYSGLAARYSDALLKGEIFVVSVFSFEYLARLWASPSRGQFIVNFYNIIDLLAILPIFFTGQNLGGIRVIRLVRFARALRILRMAKVMRLFFQTSTLTTSRIIQENVVKNISVIIGIILVHEPIDAFLRSTNVDVLGDIMFAASILALAAMFGFFSLSYGDFNPLRTSQRLLIHLTTGLLLLPVGVMFSIIQIIISIELATFPLILVAGIWFVYAAVMLWDFANVLKLQETMKAR
ncbi:MAG: ion transporter [Candidatus Uhrbacteria bacterium]|nr:ion transporter [Candidatus Uhrbacteria bacterium]